MRIILFMWQHLPINMNKFSIFNFQFSIKSQIIKSKGFVWNLKNWLFIGTWSLKIVIFFLLFPLSHYLLSMPARAQSFSLGIYPPILEVMIMPGKTITQKYELSNGENKITLTPKIVVFTPTGEKGNVQFPDDSKEIETLKKWFSFENTAIEFDKPFILNPNEVKSTLLKISIPPAAAEKDYYLTLMFSSEPQPQTRGSGVYQVGVIGSNLLVTVSKDGKPLKQGEVAEFKLNGLRIIDSFDSPTYIIRLKNSSKTYWKPFGKIATTGLIGQKWEQELIPDNILGNSIREIQVSTPSANPKFLIGPYQAKIEFVPDQEEAKISQTISYFAFPFKGLLGVVIAVIIIRFIGTFYAKSRS
jgi:hypothetical protein